MTNRDEGLHKALHRIGICLARTEAGGVVGLVRFVYNRTTGAVRPQASFTIQPDSLRDLVPLVFDADLFYGEDAPSLKAWIEHLLPAAGRKLWVCAKSQVRWGQEEQAVLASPRDLDPQSAAEALVALLGKAAPGGGTFLEEVLGAMDEGQK